jgi:lantibiotic modifying enzyme
MIGGRRRILFDHQMILILFIISSINAFGAASGSSSAQPRFVAAAEERPYLAAAEKAARWIISSGQKTADGLTWPVAPLVSPLEVNTTLYSGTPGVVLFFGELSRATGSKEYLQLLRGGADHLAAQVPGEKAAGLYEGLAGLGFALNEAFKLTAEPKHQEAFLSVLAALREGAKKQGAGVEWNSTTDIISGSAGIGLFLLYAAQETKDAGPLDLAARAGSRLVELGRPEAGGLKWAMDPELPRLMPNFSHGTAGIAYFLATLYQKTKRTEFLDAALAGARYLLAVAKTEGDTCLVFHNEPDGKDLYYLGWCHGPVGTARLFYRLWEATGDRAWLAWVRKSAHGIMTSGIPEKETPGFWNNAGICCGLAGAGEFFLDLYSVTKEKAYFDFCDRITDRLFKKATLEDGQLYWIQAEHRVRPDFLVAQTGYMQGAAGIGMFLLKLDAVKRGQALSIVFPDTPFGRRR